MIKQIRWPIWLVISLLFILLTLVFTLLIKNITHDEAITVQVKSKQIDTGIKLQTETKDANSFTSSVTYPYTDIETIDLPIHEWVSEQEDLFFDEMEQIETMLDEPIKAHLHVKTDFSKVDEHIFSFVITSEQSVDTENEYTLLKTFIIDLKKESLIDFNHVVNIDEDNDLFIEIIKDNMTEENFIDDLDDNQLNGQFTNSDNLNWELQEDSIHFHFNPGQIGSHQHITTITVPIIQLHTFISEQFEPLLITEEMATLIKMQPRKLEKDGKYIALTFDDGPSDTVTPKVLKTLKEYDAKATFFMLGQNAANYPKLAKEIAHEGHEIANHSVTHANLNAVNANRIKTEVIDSVSQIEKATGVVPTTFRPPYGEFNKTVIKQAEKSDQSIIMWSVDTLDWQNRNANTIFERTKNATNGSIVLMHDIHPTTADALPKIMKHLADKGFEFVTVTELLPLIEGEGVGPYYGN